jgi:hypothetical protein
LGILNFVPFQKRKRRNLGKMEELSDFKSLRDVPGFNALQKQIRSATSKDEKQNYINHLAVAKALKQLPELRLVGLEYGNPPKDIVFEYSSNKYVAEIKTLHQNNKVKQIKDKLLSNSGSQLIKIPENNRHKEIADIICKTHDRQLEPNCPNILFVMSETRWFYEDDFRSVLRIIFEEERKKLPKLNAVCFREHRFSPPNFLYENPNTHGIHARLKCHIRGVRLKQ